MTTKKAYGVLVLITALWGVSFPVMEACLEKLGPFSFVAVRYLTGAVVLTLLCGHGRKIGREEIRSGILIGIPFAAAAALQMIGLSRTSVANTSFITGLTAVFVPVIAFLFDRVVPSSKTKLGIAVSLIGVVLMSRIWGSRINSGDLWVLASCLAFSVQIYHLEKYGKGKDPVSLTLVVLWTVAILTAPAAFALESGKGVRWDLPLILSILFVGGLCTAWAIYMQNRYQPSVPSSQAAVIYLLEPVTATALSCLLGDKIQLHQIAGGAAILAGAWIMIRAGAAEERMEVRELKENSL